MTEENQSITEIQKIIEEIDNLKQKSIEFKNLYYKCKQFECDNFRDYGKFFLNYNTCSEEFSEYENQKLHQLRKKLCELRGE